MKPTLHCNHKATLALDHLRHHVIDQAVLVPDALLLKLLLVILLVDFLEDVLESAIVLLENGVLGAHVERQTLQQSHPEAGVGEASDRLVSVVLCLRNAGAVKVEDFDALRLSALGGVDKLQSALARNQAVRSSVLVTKCMATNDDRLLPTRDDPRNSRNYDGLSENGTAAGVR